LKLLTRLLPACALLALSAAAQQSIDVYAGASAPTAPASTTGIDTFGDGTLLSTPKLNGVFPKFGANIKFNQYFGAGAELNFRAAKGDYAGLSYRPMFFDFYGVYTPLRRSRTIVPELQAGLGAVNLRYYYDQSSCNALLGCSGSSSLVGSSKHFTTHAGGGVKMYVHKSLFVEPEFKIRYVNNFFQFKRNWVPEYGVKIGYTFGER